MSDTTSFHLNRSVVSFAHQHCSLHWFVRGTENIFGTTREQVRQYQQNTNTAMNRVKLFCQNSSLRGVGKITKSGSIFLRILWFTYVFGMIIALIVSSSRIVTEFLTYDTAIQTSIKSNDQSYFPALTVCNFVPFSKAAVKLWESGRVLSPTSFSRMIRRTAEKYLSERNVELAYSLANYDSIRIYYQSISFNESKALSHKERDLFIFCQAMFEKKIEMGGSLADCDFKVKLWSHPTYFNCYTIEPDSRDVFISLNTSAITVVLQLADAEEDASSSRLTEAFMTDIFQRGSGARLAVHEPNTIPNLEKDTIHVEPGKVIEVAYRAQKWVRYSTPKAECLTDVQLHKIPDLDRVFAYSYDKCWQSYLAKLVEQKCHCILSSYPRPKIPTKKLRYCHDFSSEKRMDIFLNNTMCAGELIYKHQHFAREKMCLRRCTYWRYTKQLSTTTWRKSDWQLYWYMKLAKPWTELTRSRSEETGHYVGSNETFFKWKSQISEYLQSKRLSESHKSSHDNHKSSSNFAFVKLIRRDMDTEMKDEKLRLSAEGMLSRVGGLCSLFLGLTCAFVVELIEFFYLAKTAGKLESEEPGLQQQHNCQPSPAHLPRSSRVPVQLQYCRFPGEEFSDVRVRNIEFQQDDNYSKKRNSSENNTASAIPLTQTKR